MAESVRSRSLESLLWGGFSALAQPLLREKVDSPGCDAGERAYACWALARWAAFQGDHVRALDALLDQYTLTPDVERQSAWRLLFVDCLNRLGQPEEALVYLDQWPRVRGQQASLALARANALWACGDGDYDSDRLTVLSRLLSHQTLAPLKCRYDDQPLTLDNLACAVPPSPRNRAGQSVLVSVVVPAFECTRTLPNALRSLLAQTWTHLEVLVVDDSSRDDTRAVAEQFAREDRRIRVLSTPSNGGAYAARNLGLWHARGELITVHDADDWSHAQKLEVQARYMADHSECPACITDWARAREDLYFTGTFRAHGSLVSENTSSLMVRREVFERLGGWIRARTSADSEYLMRIRKAYGEEAIARLYRGVPLAFALDQETSLTRTPVTHARTLFYGPRREFRETAAIWHEQEAEGGSLYIDPASAEPPFPVPPVMRAGDRTDGRRFDLVVIADFNLGGGAFMSTMHYVDAALAQGLKVALFHWRRADLDVTAPLRPELRRRAMGGEFDILSPGDQVSAETILVGYPVVLNYRLDRLPEIAADRFVILVNQMASRLRDGRDPQYDPRRIQDNVTELFGLEPLWVPISGHVYRLMWDDWRYPEPYHEPWTPLLDTRGGNQYRVHWRGDERERPVIGRHSRDHYTKWPAAREALEAAYCANRACEVRFLGGADFALWLLGYEPDNWAVEEYAETTHSFLQELDFFVHFPHEQYIEEFGRAVLEAMGMGIPPILPPVFRETFGKAALYAEPEEVWPLIERLWADRAAWEAASERALAFVRDNAGYDVLPGRLERIRRIG